MYRTQARRDREDAMFELTSRFCDHAKDGQLGQLAQADIAMISYRLELGVGLEEKVRRQKNDLQTLRRQIEVTQARSLERLEAIRRAARLFTSLDTDDITDVQEWLGLSVVRGALER